jgi:hypothetical protein
VNSALSAKNDVCESKNMSNTEKIAQQLDQLSRQLSKMRLENAIAKQTAQWQAQKVSLRTASKCLNLRDEAIKAVRANPYCHQQASEALDAFEAEVNQG